MLTASLFRNEHSGLIAATGLHLLTGAFRCWQTGLQSRRAVFHLFCSGSPDATNLRYLIAAGLGLLNEKTVSIRFTVDDIQYLGRLTGEDHRPLFTESFLNYLQRLTFSGDIDAVAEGAVVFPGEPLLRLEAPLAQGLLLESLLLHLVGSSTEIATRTAFSPLEREEQNHFRKHAGLDGRLIAARAAYLAGQPHTDYLPAGRFFGIPVKSESALSPSTAKELSLCNPNVSFTYELSALQDESGAWQYHQAGINRNSPFAHPGRFQVRRFFAKDGRPVGDLIADLNHSSSSAILQLRESGKVLNFEGYTAVNLLQPVFRQGKRMQESGALSQSRSYCLQQQQLFNSIDTTGYPHEWEAGRDRNEKI